MELLNQDMRKKDYLANDVKDLDQAKKNDISFFHSINYLSNLKKTKASFIC